MKDNRLKALILALCGFCLFLTFQAAGWFSLLFGIAFIASYLLQIWIVFASTAEAKSIKPLIFASSAFFIVLCLFREDCGDGAISCVSPLTVIAAKMDFIEHAYYQDMTFVGMLVNFLWFALIAFQIWELAKIRRLKRKHSST